MKQIGKGILLAIVLAAISGCVTSSFSPTIKTTKKLNAGQLGVVAVLPFTGHNGEQFADSVAQELLMRGTKIVERSHITSILIEQGLSVADITSGRVNYEKIGGLLGVNAIAIGSVSPIVVYISGTYRGVKTAAIRIVSVETGMVIGAVTYSANTENLAFSVTYPEVAERLIRTLFQGE